MSIDVDKIWKDMVTSSKFFLSTVGIAISGINFYNCFLSQDDNGDVDSKYFISSPKFTKAPASKKSN